MTESRCELAIVLRVSSTIFGRLVNSWRSLSAGARRQLHGCEGLEPTRITPGCSTSWTAWWAPPRCRDIGRSLQRKKWTIQWRAPGRHRFGASLMDARETLTNPTHRKRWTADDGQPGTLRTVIADATCLRAVLARFQEPLPHVAAWQIITTILPLIALLVAMHAGLAFGCWPVLALGVPAGALTVRTFIIQHDCGHRSFCRARRANDYLGRFCSLLTLTPYSQWRRHHAKHHGAWNDLDRRGAHGRDIYSSCLTVAEYNALGICRRLLHRIAKHPAISLLVLPPVIFLVLYRFPFAAPRNWRAERHSVHLTNLSLIALHGALAATLGSGPVATVLLAVMVAVGDREYRLPPRPPCFATDSQLSVGSLPRCTPVLRGCVGTHPGRWVACVTLCAVGWGPRADGHLRRRKPLENSSIGRRTSVAPWVAGWA